MNSFTRLIFTVFLLVVSCSFCQIIVSAQYGWNTGDLKPDEPMPYPRGEHSFVEIPSVSTFKQVVDDSRRSWRIALIWLYAPWSGHDKVLEPEFEELAQKFAAVKKVVIARAVAVSPPADLETRRFFEEEVQIRGTPSLRFYLPSDEPSNGYVGTSYDGPRTYSAMRDALLERLDEDL